MRRTARVTSTLHRLSFVLLVMSTAGLGARLEATEPSGVAEAAAAVIEGGVGGEMDAAWAKWNGQLLEKRHEALAALRAILREGGSEEKRVVLQTVSWIGGREAHAVLLDMVRSSDASSNLRQTALVYLLGTSGFLDFSSSIPVVDTGHIGDPELRAGIERVQNSLAAIRCESNGGEGTIETVTTLLEPALPRRGPVDQELARQTVHRVVGEAMARATGHLPDGTQFITRPFLEKAQEAEILVFGEAAVPALVEIMDSGSGFENHLARLVLAKLGGPEAVAGLERVITKREHPRANVAFLTLLAATSFDAILSGLQEVAEEGDSSEVKDLAKGALCLAQK